MFISIINQKGGVGKTTTVFNLAHILSEKGYNVLAIDADPQANLTQTFGKNPLEIEVGLYEVLLKNENIFLGLEEINENLFLLGTNLNLVVAENEMSGRMARELMLTNSLREVKDKFDFILIDCPPSLSNLSINAIVASDYVLIPVQTDYLAVKGLELLTDNIENIKQQLNPDIEMLGIVATFKQHTNHSNDVYEVLKENYDLLGTIPQTVNIKDSLSKNEPIHKNFPGHEASKEYIKIADKLIELKGDQ